MTFLDSALERAAEAAADLLRAGWEARFAASWSDASDESASGPQLWIVAFRNGAAQLRGAPATNAELGALRGRTFLAAVAPDDVASLTAAYAAGALDVVEPAIAPAALIARLEHALELVAHRGELDRCRARLQIAQSIGRMGFWEIELDRQSVTCSAIASEILALEDRAEERPLERWIAALPSDCRPAMQEWIATLAKGLSAPAFEHTLIEASGAAHRLRHVGRSALDEGGRSRRITVLVEELRGTTASEPAPRVSADDLGYVLDSAGFLHNVERAIRNAGRTGRHVAVLYLDVHRIKSLTAGNLSSNASELLLNSIASRVREGIRDKDVVGARGSSSSGVVIARLGGDHFSVLLSDLVRMQDSAKVAARILDLLSQPFEIAGCELCVPASIGIAGFPTDHHSADELLRRAETAAYCARQDGHASMKFYSTALDAKAFERLTLETSLRRALERRELAIYYQPRIDIRAQRIVGFEALLRWKHPDLGFVSPAQFIPLAEETGLIIPIGDWVLREACRQNREWQDAGLTPVRIAVNLSSVQFGQPALQDSVRKALEETRLDAPWLELELTESTVMHDASAAVSTLARLKSAGVHLSIDDFGTGYSSLAYLKRFPIDALKIDQSFIRESTTNPDDAAIVTSIILMARSLKLTVVAEGVETESQLSLLRVLQCDEVQGYLFSPPVPAPQARVLLEGGVQWRSAA